MNEKMKRFLREFGTIFLQFLLILSALLMGLWLFADFIIYGGVSLA